MGMPSKSVRMIATVACVAKSAGVILLLSLFLLFRSLAACACEQLHMYNKR